MQITSLTVNSFETVDQTTGALLFAGTELIKRTGGQVSTFRGGIRWTDGSECVLGLGVLGSCYLGKGSAPGLAVAMTADSQVQFAGKIARVATRRESPSSYVREIECQDYTLLLATKILGSSVHTSLTDRQIIQSIFTDYLPSIDTSSVEETATFATLDLSSLSLRDALDRICLSTQAEWFLTPALVLIYRDPSGLSNAFGIAESYDDITTFAPLLDGTTFTEEFSNPANHVVVRNVAFEATTLGEFAVAASGDDGEVSQQQAAYPPSGGSPVVDTSGTTMTARNQFIAATPGTITPTISTGSHDGHVGRTGASFPPDGGTNFQSDSGSTMTAQASWNGSSYTYANILMRFDTSAIPDTATITSASLSCFILTTNSNSASLCANYYNSWAPSMSGSADYNSTADDTAIAFVTLASLATGTNVLTLQNLNGTGKINKTGYTGLRFHVLVSGSPTGTNSAVMFTNENGSNIPTLTVNYSDGGTDYKLSIAAVRFDTSAIPDSAGVRAATLILYGEGSGAADTAKLGIESYASSNWPISSGDWTSTPSNSASGYTSLAHLSGSHPFSISNPETAIDVTGYSGFRIHVNVISGTPTGDNYATFSTKDHGTAGRRPVLQVTYALVPLIEDEADDTASQAVYGVLDDIVVDSRIKSAGDALLRAEAEVVRRAWPQKQGAVSFSHDGCEVAKLLFINNPSINMVGSFPVRQITAHWETKDRVKYTAEVGDRKRSLVELLRKINRVE